ARLQADRDGYVDPAVHPGRGRQDRALRARPARARARSIPWSGWPESGADHDPAGARDGHPGPQIRGPVGAVPDVRRREDPGHSPARSIRRDHQRWRTPRRVRSSGVERAQPLPTPRAQPVPLSDRAVTADSRQVIPGWYGKLPNIGDFASRRLEGQFISARAAWLQELLQAWRHALGDRRLARCLTMPIWRVLSLPALVGPSGCEGVLTPSVDRGGPKFPLTLAVALSSYAAAAHAAFHGAEWFAGLEETALDALDPTRGPDELDQSMAERRLILPRTTDGEGPHRRGPPGPAPARGG